MPEADRETPERVRSILIIEDDAAFAGILGEIAVGAGYEPRVALRGDVGLALARKFRPDVIVLDLRMPGLDGLVLLDQLKHDAATATIPVCVVSGSSRGQRSLRLGAFAALEKPITGEQLIAVLRQIEDAMDADSASATAARRSDPVLANRKVLIVDDDPRNLYALRQLLEAEEMSVIEVGDGLDAIAALERHAGIDLVVMDIMMPIMDGYEAMRRIRANPVFRDLPIVALTAKTTSQDRESCLDAGATDYIAKPVDTDQLFSVVRVALTR
jgi:CheY-like chemotaxis protein